MSTFLHTDTDGSLKERMLRLALTYITYCEQERPLLATLVEHDTTGAVADAEAGS